MEILFVFLLAIPFLYVGLIWGVSSYVWKKHSYRVFANAMNWFYLPGAVFIALGVMQFLPPPVLDAPAAAAAASTTAEIVRSTDTQARESNSASISNQADAEDPNDPMMFDGAVTSPGLVSEKK